MENTRNYSRPAFPNRPWITGKLYDQYASPNIMHCDAFVLSTGNNEYLVIDWRQGGHKRLALDAWLIEPDGLTPVWDTQWPLNVGKPVYWSRANTDIMARVHARVIAQAGEVERLSPGRWARVVIQAHYVHVADTDCEIAPELNKYVGMGAAVERVPTMGELHAKPGVIGKRRGWPRKVDVRLPDWL